MTNKHQYVYNPANQRTNTTRTDGSTVAFKYDNIGQLTVADSSVDSEDLGYYYDSAWNLNRHTNSGGVDTFLVDNKNQLTNAPVWEELYGSPDSGVTCTLVPDSEGKEDSAFECCRGHANDGIWFPGYAGVGAKDIPPHPRFGSNNGIR